MELIFSTGLINLPALTFADVEAIAAANSSTNNTNDKGYKFFHEEFIHSYQVSNIVEGQVVVRSRCFRSMKKSEEPHRIQISLEVERVELVAYSCSCAAGKGFCNHVVALLYQTAHYSQLKLPAVPPALACTSDLQRWHRPRTQGINPELASTLVVRKPKNMQQNGLKSTLYRAYTGPLPDPDLLASGKKLSQLQPQPLMALVLDGLSNLDLVPSRFGPVPRGSPMSYQCPHELSCSGIILHHMAPDFPALPVLLHPLSSMCFVPTLGQYMHLHSLQVSPEMASQIEAGTREQSRSPAWKQLRHPRLTASRFREACRGSAEEESAATALAARLIRGSTVQTAAMKRGLQMESEVLANYAELRRVNVLPVGFIIRPDASHLVASPDGRVYDPSESPPFGLVEVKTSTKNDVSQVAHLKVHDGNASLRCSHAYYWQVQGQLAITGLEWCDFVTDTLSTITVQRVWRDESFIDQMISKLDMFYFNTFINVFISMQQQS